MSNMFHCNYFEVEYYNMYKVFKINENFSFLLMINIWENSDLKIAQHVSPLSIDNNCSPRSMSCIHSIHI